MSMAVETLGFFVAAAGLLMLGVTLPHSYWRVSTVHGNVITTSTIFENLWHSCATDSLGVYNCWEFPSMLALSGYIQACRALMITAILLGFLGLFLAMVGLRCTKVGDMTLSMKAKLTAIAGALYILTGFCGMVAISWYAFNITRDFFDPLYPGTKYELGPALYLGWSASLLCILGGLCLCSNCCCPPEDDPDARLRSDKFRRVQGKGQSCSLTSDPVLILDNTRLPYKASQPVSQSKSLGSHLPKAVSNEDCNSNFGQYGKNAYV